MIDPKKTINEAAQEEKIKWLSSFPEMNPWPVMEIECRQGITYANKSTLKLFPDIMKKQLRHPFINGLVDSYEKMQNKKIKNMEREVQVEDRWYLQYLSLVEDKKIRLYASEITERKERELELANKTAELEKMNGFMIDREKKMIQLKKELEELKHSR